MILPAVIDAITPDALNRLFQAANAGLPVVLRVVATPLDGGNGYLAQSYRLELEWTGDAPATLVAKLPLRERIQTMTPDAVRMYRREAMFHRVVAPAAPLRTVKAWVAELDEDSGAATMIFEDLGGMESFEDDETISLQRIERSLERLAAFHATYWQRTELESMDWLGHPAKTRIDQVSSERFNTLWPRMVESGAYELSSTQLRLGEMLRTKMDGVYATLHSGPETLIHADLHQENLFFDGIEPAFIDWQLAERASAAKDVAKITASCLEPGSVGREQPGLIRRYFDQLQTHGVSGYSAAALERDVHLATCHYLAMMTFLSDQDFATLASNMDTRTDFTSSRVIAACDREEVLAAVEAI